MTTYKEIFGKPIKVLTGDPAPTPVTFTVTASGGAFYIDSVLKKTLELYEGNTYIFNYPSGHPFRFATAADAAGSTEYTTGVTVNSSTQITIVVASGAPNLFYYCTNHSGMGGAILTPAGPDEYEGQIWYNQATGKFRSIIAGGAWSSGSALATFRYGGAGGGTQTAAFYGGGYPTPSPDPTNVTEEYNGTGWSSSGNMNTARMYIGGSGTQTAGLASGGDQYPSPRYSLLVEEYNGTAWSVQNTLPAANKNMGSCGLQTASLNFGGSLPAASAVNNLYDGTNWTNTGHNLNTARYSLRGAGTSTAAIAMGGDSGGNPGTTTEEYNGSSWTSVNSSPGAFAAAGSAGTQTAASTFGGLGPSSTGQNTHNNYDGTTWTTAPSLATARYYMALGPIGTQSASLCVAGNSPGGAPVIGVATEEYNFSTSIVTAATWSAGGSASGSARNRALAGTRDAAFMSGGYNGANSQTRDTEEYNGTSWTSGGDLSPQGNPDGGTYSGAACGTQTAGLFSGGSSQGSTDYYFNTSYEYDGSSWGSPATWTAPGLNGIQLFGTQTAAVGAGGVRPGQPRDRNYEYDGSSWTAGTTLPEGKSNGGQSGILTAGVIFGGSNPGLSPSSPSSTLHYDGTNWTAGGTMNFGNNGGQSATASATDTIAYQGSDGVTDTTRTQIYNGTTWVTGVNAITVTGSLRSGAGTSGAALSAGGSPNAVQEYEGETTSLNTKNISSS